MDGRFEITIRAGPRLGRGAHPRRAHAWSSAGGRTPSSTRPTSTTSKARTSRPVRPGAGRSRERIRRATREHDVVGHGRVRTSSASRSVPVGRWSATPATTRTPITATGHQRRVPRRRVRSPTRRCVRSRRSRVRRRNGRLPAHPRRRGTPDVRLHDRSSRRWSRRHPRCSSCSARCHGNQDAMNDFVSVNVGSRSPASLLRPRNVEQIMGATTTTVAAN